MDDKVLEQVYQEGLEERLILQSSIIFRLMRQWIFTIEVNWRIRLMREHMEYSTWIIKFLLIY